MKPKKIIILVTISLLTVITVAGYFYFNSESNNLSDPIQSVTSVITMATLIYGFFSVSDWRKEKENEVLYAKCNEFRSAMCLFPVLIRSIMNVIHGKNTLYRMQNNEGNTLVMAKIDAYNEAQIQLTDLMSKLQSFHQIMRNIREEHYSGLSCLFMFYVSFCAGISAAENEEVINRIINSTREHLKSKEHKDYLAYISGARLEELFIFDR
ncbi:hypothetical protein ABWR82_004447 [Salmonella enterica subsp. enterica]|nr:hypothetical protein [Salmonella enterica]